MKLKLRLKLTAKAKVNAAAKAEVEPIAKARLSSFTAISIDLESSSITIDSTLAGDKAFITNWAGLSS